VFLGSAGGFEPPHRVNGRPIVFGPKKNPRREHPAHGQNAWMRLRAVALTDIDVYIFMRCDPVNG
jgi:hypothetical protein